MKNKERQSYLEHNWLLTSLARLFCSRLNLTLSRVNVSTFSFVNLNHHNSQQQQSLGWNAMWILFFLKMHGSSVLLAAEVLDQYIYYSHHENPVQITVALVSSSSYVSQSPNCPFVQQSSSKPPPMISVGDGQSLVRSHVWGEMIRNQHHMSFEFTRNDKTKKSEKHQPG